MADLAPGAIKSCNDDPGHVVRSVPINELLVAVATAAAGRWGGMPVVADGRRLGCAAADGAADTDAVDATGRFGCISGGAWAAMEDGANEDTLPLVVEVGDG